jgi:predicted nuclease with TOPRIM domain
VSESVFRLQLAIGNAGDDDQALCRVGDVREVLAAALEVEDYGEPTDLLVKAEAADEDATRYAAEAAELEAAQKKLQAEFDALEEKHAVLEDAFHALEREQAELQANYDALRQLFGVAA